MKVHELLISSDLCCQEWRTEGAHSNEVEAFSPKAEKWCAVAAIQKTYPPSQWEEAMDRVLRALSVSDEGIAQMTLADKACSLMAWNDDGTYSFRDIREILLDANV